MNYRALTKIIIAFFSALILAGCGNSISTADEMLNHEFTVIKQIHDEIPPFTFHVQFYAKQTMREYNFHPMYEMTIQITSSDGQAIQQIDGLFQCATLINRNDLHFSDLNSNGYMDMHLMKTQDGPSGTGTHYVWLWDVESRQFRLHEQLMEIVAYSLSFSGEMGTEGLLTVFHYFRMNHWANSDFSYENGKFTQVRRTTGQHIFDHTDAAWYAHVEIEDLTTGKITVTREERNFWGTEVNTTDSDRRIVEKIDIGLSEPLLFRFDLWEMDMFEYRLVITIKNQWGDLLQQIDGLYQTTSPWTPIEGEGRQPTFVDLNFDGFLDLRIWREFHSDRGHGWASHYHFLWDGGQFVHNQEFDVLTSVHIIPDEYNKTWSFWWQEQAGARQVKETYGFVNGKFVHIGTDDTMHRSIRDSKHDSGWLAIRDVTTHHPFTRRITIYDATDFAVHRLTHVQDLGYFEQKDNLMFWRDFNNDGYTDLALGEYIRWVWCPNEHLFVVWENY